MILNTRLVAFPKGAKALGTSNPSGSDTTLILYLQVCLQPLSVTVQMYWDGSCVGATQIALQLVQLIGCVDCHKYCVPIAHAESRILSPELIVKFCTESAVRMIDPE